MYVLYFFIQMSLILYLLSLPATLYGAWHTWASICAMLLIVVLYSIKTIIANIR